MSKEDAKTVREMLQGGLWGYAYHRILLNENGEPEDYEFLDVNSSFEELTGLQREKILHKRVTEVLPGIKRDGFDWIAFYGTVALQGGNATFEQYSEPLGRWYQVQVFSSEKGYFTTLFVDISAEKRRTEELEEVRERLLLAMDAGEQGFWDWNLERDTIYFSPRYYSMLGYEHGELPMRVETCLELMHPEDRESLVPWMMECVRRGEPYEAEFRLRCKDGSYKWISGRGKSYIKNGAGKPHRAVGIHVDIHEKKEREEHLHHLSSIVEQVREPLVEMSPDFRILYMNRAAEELTGYSLEDVRGREPKIFGVHPEDRVFHDHIYARIRQGELENMEFLNRRKSGEPYLVQVTVTPLWSTSGTLRGYVSFYRDITEQRRVLEELEAQRKQFQLAIRGTNDGIWDWDIRTNKLFLSEHWKKILGYEDWELPNEPDTVASLLYKRDRERVFKHLQEYLRGERARCAIEFRMVHKDGSLRWILAKGEALRDEEGVPYRMAGSHSDITERKRAERDLALQSAMQEILMRIAKRYINMPLDEVDDTVEQSLGEISRFVGAHRAYVFDYHWDTWICTNTYEWCGQGISPQKEALQAVPLDLMRRLVEAHQRGDVLYIPEVLDLSEDDGVRQLLEPQEVRSLMTVPMMDAGGCVGFVGFDSVGVPHIYTEREKALLEIFAEIMVNLRTRKALESQLMEEKEKAQAASRAKSEFLTNMSHEIRTPLNGVIGFTELLEETPLSSVQEEYVRHANASGHALLGIINEILDFSKIEAGKLDLEMVETDLPDLAEQSISIIKYGADQKGLEVLLDLDLAMPRYAFVDPVRLKQVLANLLSNAVKFTEKGEVALQVQYAPGEGSRGRFTFSVRDTGIGIGGEEQKKLFQAFSQADSSTTRRFGGTGLGLVISRKLVQNMGGTLDLKSVPGEGSLFSFSIETECREGERRSRQQIPGVTRILGVDDNATNLLILEKMLAHWKIAFTGVSNPLEAFRLLENSLNPFDVVIMDYHMPYMKGLEAIRIIRQDLGFSPEQQPIILLHSSMDNQEVVEKSRDLGVRFRLIKPVKSEELFTYLANMAESFRELEENPPQEEPREGLLAFPEENATPLILIAEDNPVNMLLVTTLVRKVVPSARLMAVKNGKEAVRVALKENLSLLFMDVQMPEMDGNEATRIIRSREKRTGRRLPIIGITAGATSMEREVSLQAGMDDFLTKPIVLEKLQGVLAAYLVEKISPLKKPGKLRERRAGDAPFKGNPRLFWVNHTNVRKRNAIS